MMNHVADAEISMAGVRFSVSLPEELVRDIQAYADQEDRSRTKMIQLLLMEARANRQAAEQASVVPVATDNLESTA